MIKSVANRKPKDFDHWEKWRARAWVYEVLRLAQVKMNTKLVAGDPFRDIKRQIENQWKVQQRHNDNDKKVIIYDLDKFLWGPSSARTDFTKFEKGERVRLTKATLTKIDNLLPGSKIFFEIGPNGVPLWAAIRGEVTAKDFWEPLVRSGQVDDVLELFLGGSDLKEQGAGKMAPTEIAQYAKAYVKKEDLHIYIDLPRQEHKSTKVRNFKGAKNQIVRPEEIKRDVFPWPSKTMQRLSIDGFKLDMAGNYETFTRLPNTPWWDMVRALKYQLVPFINQEENPFFSRVTTKEEVDDIWFTMGEATLEIALAHLAIGKQSAFTHINKYSELLALLRNTEDSRKDLRALLRATLPVWKQWSELYKLEDDFYIELVKLVDRVYFKKFRIQRMQALPTLRGWITSRKRFRDNLYGTPID